jgi:4-amino-4-deoxy-L-arabinose transferase-like glycosyltransferase
MNSWTFFLMLIAGLLYLVIVLACYLIQIALKRHDKRRVSLPLSKMAIVASVIVFSCASIFLAFDAETESEDLSVVAYVLLSMGILSSFYSYIRIVVKERKNISKNLVLPETDAKLSLEANYPNESVNREYGGGHSITRRIPIFVILIAAFAMRLYHIGAPIVGVQSWRQADTASIAMNYHKNGYDFLHPQVNWGGDSSGYVETEFPVYAFLVAVLYKIFGFSELWGRFLSVICWIIGTYFLYLLVKKHINHACALWSCILFSILPLSLYYSRAFLPESSLIMCSIIGVFYFSKWLTTGKNSHFFFSAVFISLACLIKIPTLYIGLPLLSLAWVKYGVKTFKQWRLWIFALIVFAAVGLWYYHAHRLFLNTGLSFGIWGYGTDKWGNWNLLTKSKFWKRILLDSLTARHLTWAGTPIFIFGLFAFKNLKREILFYFWLVGVFIYFIIVTRGNYVHEYYQLPFIVPAVVFMGKILARYLRIDILWAKRSFLVSICFAAIILLSINRYREYLGHEDRNCVVMLFARDVNKAVKSNELVLAIDDGDPTVLYLSRRYGWHAWVDKIDEAVADVRIQERAKYIIGGKYIFREEYQKNRLNDLLKEYKVILNTGGYFILQMNRNDTRS